MRFSLPVRRLATLLVCFLLAPVLPSSAQDSPQFRTTVELVQLQVGVAGPDGGFVSGLAPEDFVIRVNGRERPVQVAYEVDLALPAERAGTAVDVVPAGEEPRPAAARRHFLFLFDLNFTSRRGILEARSSAIEFLTGEIHPQDMVGVATYDRYGFELLSPFTSDHEQALAAVRTLGLADADDTIQSGVGFEESISQALRELGEGPAGDDGGIGSMLSRSEFADYVGQVTNYTEQMEVVGQLLQAIEGRKHVVLFSRGFDDRALTGQSLGELSSGASSRAAGPGGVASSDPEQMYGSAEVRKGIQAMIDSFRNADAVVHAVDPTGLRQIDNDVTRQSSPIAASAFGGGGDLNTGALRNGHQSLVAMADGTGGTISWGLNDLAVALDRIEAATASFYMIGYRRAPEDPPVVDVEVRVEAPGVRVTSAPTRLAPPPSYTEMTEAQRQLQLAEFFADTMDRSDITFDVQVVPFPHEESGRLALLLEVPGLEIDRLARQRGADRVELEFAALAIGEGRERRGFVRRGLTVDAARMRAAGEIHEQSLRLTEYLDVPPGPYRVRLLLREREVGRLSTRTLGAYLPEAEAGKLRVGRPLILTPTAAPERPGAAPEFDPLRIDGREVVPAASPALAPGQLFRALVLAYNLPRDPATGEVQAGVVLEVMDGAGEVYPVTDFQVIGSHRVEDSDLTQLVISGTFPRGLPAGQASLWARIIDRANGLSVEEQAALRVVTRSP